MLPQLTSLVVIGAASVAAFPGMGGTLRRVEAERRQSGSTGIFGSTTSKWPAGGPYKKFPPYMYVANVTGLNKVPDEAHPFIAPGPTDQRGPCPGMNTLANHGYISRTGITYHDEVVQGAYDCFNMGMDLGSFFSIVQLYHTGDVRTGYWSIGGPDARTSPDNKTVGFGAHNLVGYAGGMDYHNSGIEGDGSSTRLDLYNGDDHTVYMPFWEQTKALADLKYGSLFTYTCLEEYTADRVKAEIAENPTYYFVPPTGLLDLGAKVLYALMFANGTWTEGGVPNIESISPILGVQQQEDGTWIRVPERLAENWYRSNISFSVPEIVESIYHTYSTQNLTFGANQGKVNSFKKVDIPVPSSPTDIACLLKDSNHANSPPLAPGVTSISYDMETFKNNFLNNVMDPLFAPYNCPPYNASLGPIFAEVSKYTIYGDPKNTKMVYPDE